MNATPAQTYPAAQSGENHSPLLIVSLAGLAAIICVLTWGVRAIRANHELTQNTLANVKTEKIPPLSPQPFGLKSSLTRAEAENSVLVPVLDNQGNETQCYFKTTDGRTLWFGNPYGQEEGQGASTTRPDLTCNQVRSAFENALQ